MAALAQDAREAPAFADQLRRGTRQLRQAAPIATKLTDAPLANVLEYVLGTMPVDLYDRLAGVKRVGYSLSRHPVFVIDVGLEDEQQLALAVSFVMENHRTAIQQLGQAMAAHARAATLVKWEARANEIQTAHKLVIEMLNSSTLPVGRPARHSAFVPVESPWK